MPCCRPVGRWSRWSFRSPGSCQPEALFSRDPASSASLGREGWREGEGVDREERGETQERGVERIVRPLLMGQAGTPSLALSHTSVSVCRDSVSVCTAGAGRGHGCGWAPAIGAGTHPRLLLLDKMSIPPRSRPWKRVCCRPAPAGAEQGTSSVLLALLCPGLCRPFLHGGSSTEQPRAKAQLERQSPRPSALPAQDPHGPEIPGHPVPVNTTAQEASFEKTQMQHRLPSVSSGGVRGAQTFIIDRVQLRHAPLSLLQALLAPGA